MKDDSQSSTHGGKMRDEMLRFALEFAFFVGIFLVLVGVTWREDA